MKQLRLRLTVSYAISVMALGMAWLVFHKVSIDIYPSSPKAALESFVYSDVSEGGFSQADLQKSEGILILDFNLRSGSERPHAGVAFPLVSGFQQLADKFYDLTAFDSVSVVLRTTRISHVSLAILTHDPQMTRSDMPHSERPLEMEISASRTFEETHYALSAFRTPEWWYDQFGIKNPDNLQYLDRAFQVQIGNGKGGLLGLPDQIEIKSLRFFGERKFLTWGAFGIFILCTVLFVVGLRRIHG